MSRLSAALALALLATPSAHAEVHFGRNVYIGGHDVSHQTFNRHRRGEYHLYRAQPRHPGCVWRRNGEGSRTKVCRFKTLR
ncbi:hypothetical protein M2323_000837 [Rhodoblastus acidophilus]|uniref:hypothetical protein n=1 Tax=Rhodoblastus acidophilus TaxID=1074 RepID=UPI00222485C7|nr:hypothetical protein [Rhodoblastus acidophilus]MCW2283016.1 hypothetical protein [Rhodoblastus acidophilus]MCW2331933.1 hypothetical protein [Rhodoblastus acidophilus]